MAGSAMSGLVDRKVAEFLRKAILELPSIVPVVDEKLTPFEMLVVAVISQNTNDLNTERAFERLRQLTSITPQAIADLDVEALEEALKPAGLYRNKARVLKEVAKQILERYQGDLSKVLEKPAEEARSELLSLPGVGFKTADVVLLFSKGYPFFPVDTHIAKITKRLGLVPLNADYEQIRLTWQQVFKPEEYLPAHLNLIHLGRVYCKARNPKCGECPLSSVCWRVGIKD
ncbi:MAG: endonuclease III [Candidatus Verstraetearchaeota archaeon]|nr:endonuclease III [Candidatus Verstraetearchaeota archaeon]